MWSLILILISTVMSFTGEIDQDSINQHKTIKVKLRWTYGEMTNLSIRGTTRDINTESNFKLYQTQKCNCRSWNSANTTLHTDISNPVYQNQDSYLLINIPKIKFNHDCDKTDDVMTNCTRQLCYDASHTYTGHILCKDFKTKKTLPVKLQHRNVPGIKGGGGKLFKFGNMLQYLDANSIVNSSSIFLKRTNIQNAFRSIIVDFSIIIVYGYAVVACMSMFYLIICSECHCAKFHVCRIYIILIFTITANATDADYSQTVLFSIQSSNLEHKFRHPAPSDFISKQDTAAYRDLTAFDLNILNENRIFSRDIGDDDISKQDDVQSSEKSLPRKDDIYTRHSSIIPTPTIKSIHMKQTTEQRQSLQSEITSIKVDKKVNSTLKQENNIFSNGDNIFETHHRTPSAAMDVVLQDQVMSTTLAYSLQTSYQQGISNDRSSHYLETSTPQILSLQTYVLSTPFSSIELDSLNKHYREDITVVDSTASSFVLENKSRQTGLTATDVTKFQTSHTRAVSNSNTFDYIVKLSDIEDLDNTKSGEYQSMTTDNISFHDKASNIRPVHSFSKYPRTISQYSIVLQINSTLSHIDLQENNTNTISLDSSTYLFDTISNNNDDINLPTISTTATYMQSEMDSSFEMKSDPYFISHYSRVPNLQSSMAYSNIQYDNHHNTHASDELSYKLISSQIQDNTNILFFTRTDSEMYATHKYSMTIGFSSANVLSQDILVSNNSPSPVTKSMSKQSRLETNLPKMPSINTAEAENTSKSFHTDHSNTKFLTNDMLSIRFDSIFTNSSIQLQNLPIEKHMTTSFEIDSSLYPIMSNTPTVALDSDKTSYSSAWFLQTKIPLVANPGTKVSDIIESSTTTIVKTMSIIDDFETTTNTAAAGSSLNFNSTRSHVRPGKIETSTTFSSIQSSTHNGVNKLYADTTSVLNKTKVKLELETSFNTNPKTSSIKMSESVSSFSRGDANSFESQSYIEANLEYTNNCEECVTSVQNFETDKGHKISQLMAIPFSSSKYSTDKIAELNSLDKYGTLSYLKPSVDRFSFQTSTAVSRPLSQMMSIETVNMESIDAYQIYNTVSMTESSQLGSTLSVYKAIDFSSSYMNKFLEKEHIDYLSIPSSGDLNEKPEMQSFYHFKSKDIASTSLFTLSVTNKKQEKTLSNLLQSTPTEQLISNSLVNNVHYFKQSLESGDIIRQTSMSKNRITSNSRLSSILLEPASYKRELISSHAASHSLQTENIYYSLGQIPTGKKENHAFATNSLYSSFTSEYVDYSSKYHTPHLSDFLSQSPQTDVDVTVLDSITPSVDDLNITMNINISNFDSIISSSPELYVNAFEISNPENLSSVLDETFTIITENKQFDSAIVQTNEPVDFIKSKETKYVESVTSHTMNIINDSQTNTLKTYHSNVASSHFKASENSILPSRPNMDNTETVRSYYGHENILLPPDMSQVVQTSPFYSTNSYISSDPVNPMHMSFNLETNTSDTLPYISNLKSVGFAKGKLEFDLLTVEFSDSQHTIRETNNVSLSVLSNTGILTPSNVGVEIFSPLTNHMSLDSIMHMFSEHVSDEYLTSSHKSELYILPTKLDLNIMSTDSEMAKMHDNLFTLPDFHGPSLNDMSLLSPSSSEFAFNSIEQLFDKSPSYLLFNSTHTSSLYSTEVFLDINDLESESFPNSISEIWSENQNPFSFDTFPDKVSHSLVFKTKTSFDQDHLIGMKELSGLSFPFKIDSITQSPHLQSSFFMNDDTKSADRTLSPSTFMFSSVNLETKDTTILLPSLLESPSIQSGIQVLTGLSKQRPISSLFLDASETIKIISKNTDVKNNIPHNTNTFQSYSNILYRKTSELYRIIPGESTAEMSTKRYSMSSYESSSIAEISSASESMTYLENNISIDYKTPLVSQMIYETSTFSTNLFSHYIKDENQISAYDNYNTPNKDERVFTHIGDVHISKDALSIPKTSIQKQTLLFSSESNEFRFPSSLPMSSSHFKETSQLPIGPSSQYFTGNSDLISIMEDSDTEIDTSQIKTTTTAILMQALFSTNTALHLTSSTSLYLSSDIPKTLNTFDIIKSSGETDILTTVKSAIEPTINSKTTSEISSFRVTSSLKGLQGPLHEFSTLSNVKRSQILSPTELVPSMFKETTQVYQPSTTLYASQDIQLTDVDETDIDTFYTSYDSESVILKASFSSSSQMKQIDQWTSSLTTHTNEFDNMVPTLIESLQPSPTIQVIKVSTDIKNTNGHKIHHQSSSISTTDGFSTSKTLTSTSSPGFPVLESHLLLIGVQIKQHVDIADGYFIQLIQNGLLMCYLEGLMRVPNYTKRRKRDTITNLHSDANKMVIVTDVQRRHASPLNVDITFYITYNTNPLTASSAESVFDKLSLVEASALLGYPVSTKVRTLSDPPNTSPESVDSSFSASVTTVLILIPILLVTIAAAILLYLYWYEPRKKGLRTTTPWQLPNFSSMHKPNLDDFDLMIDVENGKVVSRTSTKICAENKLCIDTCADSPSCQHIPPKEILELERAFSKASMLSQLKKCHGFHETSLTNKSPEVRGGGPCDTSTIKVKANVHDEKGEIAVVNSSPNQRTFKRRGYCNLKAKHLNNNVSETEYCSECPLPSPDVIPESDGTLYRNAHIHTTPRKCRNNCDITYDNRKRMLPILTKNHSYEDLSEPSMTDLEASDNDSFDSKEAYFSGEDDSVDIDFGLGDNGHDRNSRVFNRVKKEMDYNDSVEDILRQLRERSPLCRVSSGTYKAKRIQKRKQLRDSFIECVDTTVHLNAVPNPRHSSTDIIDNLIYTGSLAPKLPVEGYCNKVLQKPLYSSLTLSKPPRSINNFIEGDLEDDVFLPTEDSNSSHHNQHHSDSQAVQASKLTQTITNVHECKRGKTQDSKLPDYCVPWDLFGNRIHQLIQRTGKPCVDGSQYAGDEFETVNFTEQLKKHKSQAPKLQTSNTPAFVEQTAEPTNKMNAEVATNNPGMFEHVTKMSRIGNRQMSANLNTNFGPQFRALPFQAIRPSTQPSTRTASPESFKALPPHINNLLMKRELKTENDSLDDPRVIVESPEGLVSEKTIDEATTEPVEPLKTHCFSLSLNSRLEHQEPVDRSQQTDYNRSRDVTSTEPYEEIKLGRNMRAAPRGSLGKIAASRSNHVVYVDRSVDRSQDLSQSFQSLSTNEYKQSFDTETKGEDPLDKAAERQRRLEEELQKIRETEKRKEQELMMPARDEYIEIHDVPKSHRDSGDEGQNHSDEDTKAKEVLLDELSPFATQSREITVPPPAPEDLYSYTPKKSSENIEQIYSSKRSSENFEGTQPFSFHDLGGNNKDTETSTSSFTAVKNEGDSFGAGGSKSVSKQETVDDIDDIEEDIEEDVTEVEKDDKNLDDDDFHF